LREARSERQLSVERVAAALHLSPRQIVALEEDDYESLPGATYVRGYLRSYAHYLGLPVEPVLAAFNRLPAATRRVEFTAPAPAPELTSSHALIKLGTVLVAAVVLGLAAIWWSGQDSPAPPAGPYADLSGADAPQAESGVNPAEPTTKPAAAEATAETATESAPEREKATRSETAQLPSAVDRAEEPPPVIAPDAPRSRLVLYVHQDSWADVRDARQQRLVYDTIEAGRVVTLEGVAPLQVFLGNVDGVRVEFEGKPYDAMRHKRGQVARFTLGTPPKP
jgi:cytoskeleton protein RodZ